MENFSFLCIKSRIEHPRSFYGCFELGPFDLGQGITVANSLRRALLSELYGLAITAVEIKNVTHEYSTPEGIKESVLEILLNLKQIVFTSKFGYYKPKMGYLSVNGPGNVTAGDMKLPCGIQCVDPNQHIATLSYNGKLSMKFLICQGKNYILQNPSQLNWPQSNQMVVFSEKTSKNLVGLKNFSSYILPLDAVFMPIQKVNFLLEIDDQLDKPKDKIILEVWTNGSIHPSQAISKAAKSLVELFVPLRITQILSSNLPKSVNSKSQKFYDIKNRLKLASHLSIEETLNSLDIGNLDLKIKTYTILKKANINTIGDLLTVSSKKLLSLPICDKVCIVDIKKALNKIGLNLLV